ncbi:hypothetical protein ACWGJ9_11675 [Curtobacterium citreum]
MSALLTGRAAAADRQLAAATSHLAALRRLRVIVPTAVLMAAVGVGLVATSVHLALPLVWWVLFAGALPAAAWWILEAACRSQRRAALRAEAIRDGAWGAAARAGAHLSLVDG